MSFELNLDSNAALSAGRGGALGTGVHKVKVTGAYLAQTEKGNNVLDLELESTTGAKATVYGMCIDAKWKSNAENYDYVKWQELAAVAGMKTGATSAVKRTDYAGVESDAVAFDELTGIDLTVALQVEIGLNRNGDKEVRKRKLYRTFTADGKSLAEKQANGEAKQAVQLAGTLKDYQTKAHKEWKASGGAIEVAAETTAPADTSGLLD